MMSLFLCPPLEAISGLVYVPQKHKGKGWLRVNSDILWP